MMTRLSLALLLTAVPAMADHEQVGHDHGHGAIQIGRPWAPATPPAAQVGAGYAAITNEGDSSDRLLGAETPVAGRVELHLMSHENGLMTMRPQPDGAELPVGGTLELQPGGLHLMLLDLIRPLQAGETFPITLKFQQAGRIEAEFTVRPAAGHHGKDHGVQAAHSH